MYILYSTAFNFFQNSIFSFENSVDPDQLAPYEADDQDPHNESIVLWDCTTDLLEIRSSYRVSPY